jgi:hypothetical protein
MDERLRHVPEKVRGRFAEVVAITDGFCARHLDEEYRDLCRDMVMALCRSGLPLPTGKAAGWAAAVVYLVGWVNFLSPPSRGLRGSTRQRHLKPEEVEKSLEVSSNTLMGRARLIRDRLKLKRMDPRWATTEMLEWRKATRRGGTEAP